MRPVRFTKAEARALRDILGAHQDCLKRMGSAADKVLVSVLSKLDAAESPAHAGVAVGPIEQVLVDRARGKVVELASGPSGYARASKLATAVGATVTDAEVVGDWLARQAWLREPTTVLGVLNKWAEWLPRARATAPPPAAREGFDGPGDAGQGAGRPGGRGGSGRRGEGFR